MPDRHIAQRKAQEPADNRCGNRRYVKHVAHSHNDCRGKGCQRVQVGTQDDRDIVYEDVTQHATTNTGQHAKKRSHRRI